LLSGFPSVSGVFPFTVAATSASTGNCTGATPYSFNVPAPPAAVTDLAATRLGAGNDASGIERIQLSFTPTALATSAEVYRASFGGYPRYDESGGLEPPIPSYPPGAPWVLTAVTT